MRTSAAGNKASRNPLRTACQQGFTLIELLVVVSIIAIASAGVAFALRDTAQSQLEREAQRLSALLESARAQSRTSGVAVIWRSSAQGFVFDGLPPGSLPNQWLDPDTTVADNSHLELGPEPIIAAQSLTLRNRRNSALAWRVASDGLRPFAPQGMELAGTAANPAAARVAGSAGATAMAAGATP